jgi:hypothetical protein
LPIPVFFWPGDEIVFNPSPGSRTREGVYLQTTTFLRGKKKPQENPFSFLQATETEEGKYRQELHGIFLHKIPGTGTGKETGETLKLLIDAYSRLGAMVGLAGDFPSLATFRTSIGVSRSIFQDPISGAYTPFWIQSDGTPMSYWNKSILDLPFRFGLEGDLKSSADFGSLTTHFEYFSDPSFSTDFYNRSEGINLTDVIGTTTPPQTTVSPKYNLSWDMTSRIDLTKLLKLPAVQSLSLPYLNMKFTWQSKDAPVTIKDPEYWDPGRTFFFPASLTLPNAAIAVSGDILKISSAAAEQPKTEGGKGGTAQPAAAQTGAGSLSGALPNSPEKEPMTDPGKGFRMPTPSKIERPEQRKPEKMAFRESEMKKDTPVMSREPESNLSISYVVQPRLTVENAFDSSAWLRKEDVDFRTLYRTLETGGSGKITASGSILDRMAELTATLGADGTYRTRFSPSSSIDGTAVWLGLLSSDLQQDRLDISSALQTTVRPFPAVPELSASNLSWKLGLRMYQLRYTGTGPYDKTFTGTGPSWSNDSVTEHSAQSTISFKNRFTTDSLAITALLPPLNPSLTARMDLAAGILKGRAQGGVVKAGSGLQYPPLLFGATVSPATNISADEELQFNVDARLLDRSTALLKAGDLTGSFTAERFGGSDTLSPSTLRLAYNSTGAPFWFWKDRVRLDASVKSAWNMNLQDKKYTENIFDFTFQLSLTVFQSLELTFSSVSYNSTTYRYFPSWATAEGTTWRDPITDLLKSVNFFNINDRYDSGFKIRSLSLKAVHHLRDWDLSVEYQGAPQLRTQANGTRRYEWSPTFSVLVQWLAVPEIKGRVHGDYTGVSIRD